MVTGVEFLQAILPPYSLHRASPETLPWDYGGAALPERTAAHDTPSLDCEFGVCEKKDRIRGGRGKGNARVL